MKTLDIFISSPGDVIEERALANRAIERLQSEYAGRIVLQPVLWEHEPLLATGNFQEQIVQPSDTEIFIAILWSRLGTRLPKGYERPDGSRQSNTSCSSPCSSFFAASPPPTVSTWLIGLVNA